uniref:Uncharacterized protein n=1 Tax=Ascaris lumbricoides TaxID=6252 RepID=A0A0M3HLP4_ASCLU
MIKKSPIIQQVQRQRVMEMLITIRLFLYFQDSRFE